EHRHMNEMVDFERHRLWQVISEAPVAIALLDSQLRFITCSQKFITDYGILTKDIFAKRLWDILPWMAEKWAPMCERALAGDAFPQADDTLPLPGGDVMHVRRAVQPLRNASGAVEAVVIVTDR